MNNHHLTAVSRRRPSPAQLEPVIQIIGILGALLSLIEQFGRVFGISLQKQAD